MAIGRAVIYSARAAHAFSAGIKCRHCISRKNGVFACSWFVKEGYFFVPRYEVWGLKIPLQSTNYPRLWCRVTPEVTGLLSLLPLNRQRIIKSNVEISDPVHLKKCRCFDKRRGFFTEKSQPFLQIRVLLWPEISALGVLLNFDNERMHPLNTKVPSPGIDYLDSHGLWHRAFVLIENSFLLYYSIESTHMSSSQKRMLVVSAPFAVDLL